MSTVTSRLGYGQTGTVTSDLFTRMMHEEFFDDEEVRKQWINGNEYIGLATSGSDPSLPVWSVIKITWQNNLRVRWQYANKCVWNSADQSFN